MTASFVALAVPAVTLWIGVRYYPAVSPTLPKKHRLAALKWITRLLFCALCSGARADLLGRLGEVAVLTIDGPWTPRAPGPPAPGWPR